MTTQALPSAFQAISAQLVGARATGRALSGPPSGLPETLDDAYRLQAHSIAAWDDDVAGWKVGGIPPHLQQELGANFLAGPIFKRSVQWAEGAGTVMMPVFADGFAAIEPEFIFMLGASEAEDRMFIGCEIASSPIPKINDYGPLAVVSDFGNNRGIALGPEVTNWQQHRDPVTVKAVIDGSAVGEKRIDDFFASALASLAFLRALASQRGFDLPAGTFVSSGAITGIHDADVGAKGALDFGDLGSINVELTSVPVS